MNFSCPPAVPTGQAVSADRYDRQVRLFQSQNICYLWKCSKFLDPNPDFTSGLTLKTPVLTKSIDVFAFSRKSGTGNNENS